MTPGLRVAPAVSDEDVRACLPVLRELRPHLGACHALVLDSGVDNVGAHRFYMRQGLDIRAFRFARALEPLFAR